MRGGLFLDDRTIQHWEAVRRIKWARWFLREDQPVSWFWDISTLGQKDREARWMVRQGRKPQKTGKTSRAIMIAVPYFGYKNHLSIDRWQMGWSTDGTSVMPLLMRETSSSLFWIKEIPLPLCGRIRPVDLRKTRRVWSKRGFVQRFTLKNKKGSLCVKDRLRPIQQDQKFGLVLSMCSGTRRVPWTFLFIRLALCAPKQRLDWQIWLTISDASYG